jgi:DNA polymerase-1
MAEPASLLLVDTNVLGIGAMREWQYRDRSHRGRETGAILGIAEKLSELIAEHPGRVPIAIWDDRCGWREALLPRYKRHRWETPEQVAFLKSYLWQVDVARKLLGHLGFPQIFCPGFEADDVVGAICSRADPAWLIRLATTDSDWFQALRTNVDWFSVSTGKIVTHNDLGDPDHVVGAPFGSVDHYIKAKALAGDSSDGIPGVVGVGVKTAAKIIREYGSIEALWAIHDAGEPIKGVVVQRAAGPQYRSTYRLNLQLIDWRLAPAPGPNLQIETGMPDHVAAARLCKLWGLPSTAAQGLILSSEVSRKVIDDVRASLATG